MCIGVEINDLPIGKADPKTVFNKHVAFFFLGESRLAAGFATLGMTVGVDERGLIVDELNSFREVNAGTRLARNLVECG